MKGLETYAKAFVAHPNEDSKLIRASSYLSSNANSTQQTDHSLAKLLDGKTNTYYETWDSGIVWPDEMPYIQARLTSNVNAFAFTFTPSQHAEYGQTDIPTDIIVSASPNTRNLITVARLTENMPTSISESYTSPVIFTDGDSRVLRFQVMETVGRREDSRVFAMSEFQIHEAVIDEDESPYYQKAGVKEAFDALQTELQTMRSLIVANTVTAEDRDTLRKAIEEAEKALENSTDIKTVCDSPFKEKVIYNLNGQRVSRTQKGIYIINGRKILR